MHRQGIILRVLSPLSVLLLDRLAGKMTVNLNNRPETVFSGAIVFYSLTKKNNYNVFESGSYKIFSKMKGHCLECLSWLHELLSMANTLIPFHDCSIEQSFIVLLNTVNLITSKIPQKHLEVIKCGSIASFIISLGYVKEFFLYEFVELFEQYCRISESSELAFEELDLKIQKLEKKLPDAKHLITKIRSTF